MKSKTKISKFFESLIYFILLTIPMISVFARTIYVQSNHNAKDSYSVLSNIEYESYTSLNDLLIDDTYYFSSSFGTVTTNANLYFYNVTNLKTNYNNANIDFNVYPQWRINFNPSNPNVFDFYSFDAINSTNSTWRFALNRSSYFITFNYRFLYCDVGALPFIKKMFVVGTLDNAFDYGLQKTIDDFGNGNINFINWYGSLFSNNTNLLYINFVNMYLNYALWVSLGYLMYYFLNWFIRFVRETLDNLIYKETKN